MKLQTLILLPLIACGVACNSAKNSSEPAGEFHPTSVSEDEFKAMHTPPTHSAPKRVGERIQLGGTSAYLSLPAGKSAPMPGIVVIHEWWGLNEHIERWTDRIAAEGYAAIAVDLYGGLVAKDRNQASEAMKSVDRERAIGTMKSALRFLETDPRIQAPRTASIGWCFGGAQSLNLALSEPTLDAAVIYYGKLTTDPEKLAQIQARVLGIFGSQDTSIPAKDIEALEKGLREANKNYRIKVYDAQHAFANPSGDRYDQGAAADAWQVTRDFLRDALRP